MILSKYAPNRDDAIKLMRFLVGEEAQKIYAEVNYEFPVRAGVDLSPLLKPYEGFKSDEIQMKYRSLILLNTEKMTQF